MSTESSMDERSKAVLRAAVETYIASAEPVASRAIGRGGMLLSSASIRAVLARLEACGMLFQPHTSAGRVPTQAGYRTYVDTLMVPANLTGTVRARIRRVDAGGTEALMNACAMALADAAHLPAFAVSSGGEDTLIRHIELIRLRAGELLGIVATWTGNVHHKVVRIDGDMPQNELDRLANYLNERFEHSSFAEVRRAMREELVEARRQYTLSTRALKVAELALPHQSQHELRVYAHGQHHLLAKPEFSSGNTAAPVLEELERRETWLALLDQVAEQSSISVTIGQENGVEGLQGCSVIAAALPWGDGVRGSIGLLGPTRIAYATVVSLVELLRRYVVRLAQMQPGHQPS